MRSKTGEGEHNENKRETDKEVDERRNLWRKRQVTQAEWRVETSVATH